MIRRLVKRDRRVAVTDLLAGLSISPALSGRPLQEGTSARSELRFEVFCAATDARERKRQGALR